MSFKCIGATAYGSPFSTVKFAILCGSMPGVARRVDINLVTNIPVNFERLRKFFRLHEPCTVVTICVTILHLHEFDATLPPRGLSLARFL